jgi:mRNA-degrading endonuclease YafQ of YafQ-DinJ toxin-antitoxin module
MYQFELTNKFRKDLKLAQKRGLKMEILDLLVTQLL